MRKLRQQMQLLMCQDNHHQWHSMSQLLFSHFHSPIAQFMWNNVIPNQLSTMGLGDSWFYLTYILFYASFPSLIIKWFHVLILIIIDWGFESAYSYMSAWSCLCPQQPQQFLLYDLCLLCYLKEWIYGSNILCFPKPLSVYVLSTQK